MPTLPQPLSRRREGVGENRLREGVRLKSEQVWKACAKRMNPCVRVRSALRQENSGLHFYVVHPLRDADCADGWSDSHLKAVTGVSEEFAATGQFHESSMRPCELMTERDVAIGGRLRSSLSLGGS